MSNTLIPLLQTGERLWINEARKRRRVWLLGEINNYRGAKCCYMLAELASESSEPIYFILNTEGGDVDVALGMYDLVDSIRRSGTQVITVGTGYVCSAGLVVFQSGAPRCLTPHTILLLHEMLAWSVGKVSEQEDALRGLKKCEDLILSIFHEKTGKSKNALRRLFTRKEVWMSPEEAIKHGFADKIVPFPLPPLSV